SIEPREWARQAMPLQRTTTTAEPSLALVDAARAGCGCSGVLSKRLDDALRQRLIASEAAVGPPGSRLAAEIEQLPPSPRAVILDGQQGGDVFEVSEVNGAGAVFAQRLYNALRGDDQE